MDSKEKKVLLSHMRKDDREFRDQLKDDAKLKSELLSKKKKKKVKK